MPLRIEPGAEPIPGYRLIDRLGSGGFGEVWKAEAPGGLFKAIKFVQRGTSPNVDSILASGDVDRSRAEQEWKSLLRVKTVRHPFILLLDRFENIDNYLVIVMELADRTLADRFKECRVQGLPGIPREELLSYLGEAAEVLDLMNSMYQLQHLDIKPQNLFLVHQHIKVADFGLVKDTTDGKSLMTITGGVTPVYAAPETFDGQFSRQSDQYSLAIVYQEMLTGQRPFTGTTMKQLVLQHLQNAHDLTSAPVNDRPILARALARSPEDRYPTCIEFVQALKKATLRGSADVTAGPVSPAGDRSLPSLSHKTTTSRGGAGPIKPIEPNVPAPGTFARHSALSDAPSHPSGTTTAPSIAPAERSTPAPIVAPRRKPQQSPSGNELPGIVQPALVIGIGRLGVETLAHLKEQITVELGSQAALPQVRLLAIDTDPELMQHPEQDDSRAALRTQEMFLTRLLRPSHYLKTRDGKLPTDSWLNSKLLHRIPREQNNAGLRALGRLAFVDNYRPLARRLKEELQALGSHDTPHDDDPGNDLGLRTTRPRVYVVTSLTGNTGGGMFIDLAYLVRRLLDEQDQQDAEIVGVFYLPHVDRESAALAPLANAYAGLVELQHYCRPEALFSAHYETAATMTKGDSTAATGPAFQRCILLSLPVIKTKPSTADNAAAVAQAGSFLYRDLATSLGQASDARRAALLEASDTPMPTPILQSVGMSRIHWPRHSLLAEAGRRLSSQLVTRWLSKDSVAITDTIRQWTQERWESLSMRPENLIERFQLNSEVALNQKPELLLAEVLVPVQQAATATPAGAPKINMHVGPIVKAMERLERLIGAPDDSRSSKPDLEPSTIERVFEEIALQIADECEQKLAELAVLLLEDPNFRLAGAEEALRQFSITVDQALQAQEPLSKELSEKTVQLYQRIHQLLDMPLQSASPSRPQWSGTTSRHVPPILAKTSPTDLFELVRTYTKTRYHSLVLAHLNRVYLSLRGHLSDQIREVGFCRQRLGELLRLVQPAVAPPKNYRNANERTLFPPGCTDLQDAINQLNESISPDDLVTFDQRVQNWIQEHFGALLQICMGSSGMVRNLTPALLVEAEGYLCERLQGASVADMYLTRMHSEHGEHADAMIRDDLEHCLEDATPEFGRIAANSVIALVCLPDDKSGRQLQALLKDRQADARILFTDRPDEIVFYHETLRIRWKDLEQLGPIAREAYERRSAADPASLHSREDVFDWQFILAGEQH
jgi:serine/threonine protein kinase